MPVMSEPGAHLKDLLETLEFRIQEKRRRACDLSTEAAVLEQTARELKRAMAEEARKIQSSATCSEEQK